VANAPRRWFFDVWSTFYDQPLVQRLTYRPVHDAVLAALRSDPPRRVLDLGCGTGLLTARLQRALPGAQLVGTDLSAGMLARAARRHPPVRAVQATAVALPFRDARFDAIVSTEAFHWFPDQAAALGECFRLLAPGGRLLLALVNPPLRAIGDVAFAASTLLGEPFRWPTADDLRALLGAAGFEVAEQRRIYRIPAGLLLPPVLSIARRPAGAARAAAPSAR
jgi:SAM-dependent methyltransferase